MLNYPSISNIYLSLKHDLSLTRFIAGNIFLNSVVLKLQISSEDFSYVKLNIV